MFPAAGVRAMTRRHDDEGSSAAGSGRAGGALLDAARRGDRHALEELLSSEQGRVFRFGLRMCGDEESARDVLQETLLAAARGIRDFRGASSVSTWLYTIARSFCVKARRVRSGEPSHLDPIDGPATAELADAGRSPEEQVAGAQVHAAVRDAIASLEPMYREVLVLRDVEGLSSPEVAQIVGISVEAVRSRLHRARVAVRERLAPALGVDGAAPVLTPGCPDILGLLSQKLEGEISGDLCAELERHVAACPACRGRCDSLRASLDVCRRAGKTPVPPRVERSVRAELRRALGLG
jgi:RNA polymerase sigma-70 factor (ECF subfamily)